MADDKPGIDKEMIRELASLLDETGLTEIEIERDGLRVRVGRGGTINNIAAPVMPLIGTTPALPPAPADLAKHSLALKLVIAAASDQIVIPVQALAELHSVLVRKSRLTPTEAAFRVQLWAAQAELVATGAALLDTALRLSSAHGLQISDALILAAAAEANCDLLLSEDMHDGFVWSGVTVTNPFGSAPDTRVVRLLA